MKPELKAFEVNTKCLEYGNQAVTHGYLTHEYGKTEREARVKLLTMCINAGCDTDYFGDDLEYIKLRTKRIPELDKYLVDGKLKTLSEIKYDHDVQENKDKLKRLLEENPTAYAYIRKGGYFYCSNFCGYTEFKENAGVYTIQEAVRECLGVDLRDYMRPEIIDVARHNKLIDDKINALQSRKIQS